MDDIIESGIWAQLSAAARTLYPVLCKFSNERFKEVWPSTAELLRLTGFKTKKSLQQAKKELVSAGLIDVIPGSGRRSTYYYFRFDYPGSRINLDIYRDTVASRRGVSEYPPVGEESNPLGGSEVSPNQINITISQNHNQQQEQLLDRTNRLMQQFLERIDDNKKLDFKSHIINSLLEKYGDLELGEAIKIAIKRGKDGDIRYLEGILRNRKEEPGETNSFNHNKAESEFAQLSAESKRWLPFLNLRYKNNHTFYFTAEENIPIKSIEEQFKNDGYTIKIFTSDTYSSETG